MLLGTRQKLAEEIIQAFRNTPYLAEVDIFNFISKHKTVTHRAVFKELARLVDQGILVRVKGKYAIKVTWILELLQLSDDLTRQSLHPDSLDLQIPRKGEKLSWHFRDIRRMDAFWVQLMFVLFSISSSKLMYVWCPHFWFHLLDLKKGLQAMRAMQKGGNKHYLIIGSDSFIDRLPTRYWNKKVYEWSYAKGPFAGQNNKYFDLIDDFLLTVSFSSDFVQELEKLCNKIKTEKDLNTVNYNTIFNKQYSVNLKLEHNSQKAARLRKIFSEYFGHKVFK